MPILTKHQIVRITDVMMQAGGASAGHAGIVADHLAHANLAGYDSHGFIRIPQYMKNIEDGELDPKAEPEVVGNHGAILQIDRWPFYLWSGGCHTSDRNGKGYALSVMVALFGNSTSWPDRWFTRPPRYALSVRWICGQDPRYSSSTWAAWRPWKPSGPRSNR